MEYRDRDILSAIGLECQLCIGLKKKPNPSPCVTSTPSFRYLKPWIYFGGPFKETKVSDRVSDTCISTDILVGENIFLQFSIKILTYKFNINRSYMDSTYNF